MKNAIRAILAAISLLALNGCDSEAQPDAAPMLRYQVDTGRDRSWWLTRDRVLLHSASQPKKALALPGWLWAADPHCPPDLALGPDGEAVVTSNVVQTLWRIDSRTLAVSVHEVALGADSGKDVGFVALAWSAEQGAFFAYSTRATKVSSIDLGTVRPGRARDRCADIAPRLAQFAGIAG